MKDCKEINMSKTIHIALFNIFLSHGADRSAPQRILDFNNLFLSYPELDTDLAGKSRAGPEHSQLSKNSNHMLKFSLGVEIYFILSS